MQTDPGAYRAECWRNYREANALWITGWCLFSVGFSVDVLTGLMLPIHAFGGSSSPTARSNPRVRATINIIPIWLY